MESNTIRLWENTATEINYSVTIEKSKVHEILKQHLSSKEGVQVNYLQELVHIEEPKHLTATELAQYYQYRPLPTLPTFGEQQDRTLKTIHLKDIETNQVKVWRSQAILGADGQTSTVRQKLGTRRHMNTCSPTYTYQFCLLSRCCIQK